MDWRSHRFLKIVYVLQGGGDFHFAKRRNAFSAGDVVVVPAETPNRIEDDPTSASSLYICCIATSLLQFDPALVGRIQTQCVRGDGHFANRVSSLMRRMVHHQDSSGRNRPIAMVTEAMRLVQLVLQREQPQRKSVVDTERSPHREAMARYIASLPREFFEATTIDAAAASLDMPRRTFTKLFAEESGQTWLQHIRQLAIGHAMARLVETDLPIASVAFECGFNDLSTFYRQFKSQVGMSPAAYRAA
ncbi:MAG: helix-turn-helix transcriptional regulator [Pirellulaceae bacterium]|nr:helix-turn-helix transcriptional regulator [Pirellulaceae bacterium]